MSRSRSTAVTVFSEISGGVVMSQYTSVSCGSSLNSALHHTLRGNSRTRVWSMVTQRPSPRRPSTPGNEPTHRPCSSSPSRIESTCRWGRPSYLQNKVRTKSTPSPYVFERSRAAAVGDSLQPAGMFEIDLVRRGERLGGGDLGRDPVGGRAGRVDHLGRVRVPHLVVGELVLVLQ